jgi:type IV pilus assembly protein PilA
MAAIAIPAYQDYTIRAQVSEGLNLTAASKAAVAESYQSLGTAPADRVAAGMTPDPRDTQGQYVQSVDVADGQIVVAYGNAAHASIAGRALVQTPYLTPDGSLVWLCGYAAPPPGPEAMGGTANVTTIEAKYLPSACR